MTDTSIQDQIDDATFDFTMGDGPTAISKLLKVVEAHPQCFEAWHALTEVYFSEKQLDDALKAGETALELKSNDVHVNTSLSRIWVAMGNKERAEHFGAQARMLGWKNELQSPPEKDTF